MSCVAKRKMAVAAVKHDVVVEATVQVCFEDMNCMVYQRSWTGCAVWAT